jgi:putative ABC transport system permease protein
MLYVAVKMLFNDPVKFLGLVFGVSFATLLMNQQTGFCICLLSTAGATMTDFAEANVWVMDPAVQSMDGSYPMRETELAKVRGVPGVQWATPLQRFGAVVRTGDKIENAIIYGADDTSNVGLPKTFVEGTPEDLRRPDAVAMTINAFKGLWPNEPVKLGKVFELNDRRAVVAAFVDASPSFGSKFLFFCRYSQASKFASPSGKKLAFVLVRSNPDETPEDVCKRINERTGLQALTSQQFRMKSINYVIANTGIVPAFGVVVLLGVIVGIAIVGLMFNLFVVENLRQFAALKAIGVRNGKLLRMVTLQSAIVGFTGYGIGLGLAASFFEAAKGNPDFRGFYLPWQVAVISAFVAAGIIGLSMIVSMRKVLFVDAGIVFRG